MVSAQASERALLCYLISRLHSLDADVLVGHNVAAFDLDILLHRLQHHKVTCLLRPACTLIQLLVGFHSPRNPVAGFVAHTWLQLGRRTVQKRLSCSPLMHSGGQNPVC